MRNNDKLRKALDIIALNHAEGKVSNDILIKACENYKIKSGLKEDFDYEIKVSKSFFDALNGLEPNDEVCKAIIPGQTKVVDGVMYIYSATKTGSKVQYDWHVVKKGAKSGKAVGKSGKLTTQEIDKNQKFVNELFPTDPFSLKVVKTLHGSTKPQLVEDANGNQFVMKKGGNTNKGHVKSEYLANQLYNILGTKTPIFELYEENGDLVTLSRFIQGARPVAQSDYAEVAKGFVADVLMANWDCYKNSDNCLVDAAGRVIRVDNGGCLKYRAQGGLKNPPFDGDVLATFESMKKYNPGISQLLTDDEIEKQIDDILAKKDDVVAYLIDSGEDDLAKILGERIDNLSKIKTEIAINRASKITAQADKLKLVQPRKLKPKKEMYEEFTDKQLEELWKDVIDGKKSAISALTEQGNNGWEMLSNICQLRGFDARPKVVSEKDFWKANAKSEYPLMCRGQYDMKGKTGEQWCDVFRFSDNCHYGTSAIWGHGIYAFSDDLNQEWIDARNKAKAANQWDENVIPYDKSKNVDQGTSESNYKSSKVFSIAKGGGYGKNTDECVLRMVWERGANVVDLDDLLAEVKANPPAAMANPKIKQLEDQLKKIKDDWTQSSMKVLNLQDSVKKAVYKSIGYNEDVTTDCYNSIDGTNWNSRNMQGKRDYPDFDTFVLGKMRTWVEKQGGTCTYEDDQVLFTVGKNQLYISRFSWENNAVKQANQFSTPYHYQAERFRTFYDTSIVKPAATALDDELKKSDGIAAKLRKAEADNRTKYYAKEDELNQEIANTKANDGIYGAIYDVAKSLGPRDTGASRLGVLGVYAALRGYDGIHVHNGNGHELSFSVILNRSKIVTSVS